ncbi:MAG TPA: FAD-linked oxidase C-terminal domain-containing protein [Polyangia bacterium]|nr:FAD-linked oxidase C-terminal domain-containing protein [Polyangia bacterium]
MGEDERVPRERTLMVAGPLSRRVGSHKVIDDPDLLESLGRDESCCAPVAPDLAVRAHTRDDVIATLELCAGHGVPVTARGGGTGKVGGAIPARGGVVLDLTRLNSIVEINRDDLLAVVEPGLVTGVFQQAVEDEGLFYPPDPNSLETCTLGGNAAHNAGGPRAFKYGVTREYVLGAETVLMGGRVLRTGRRTVKGVAGYDVTSLLVGSEGTLGVFTGLTLRLVHRPPALATLLLRFADEVAAGRAVGRIVAAGLVPRVMEFMDGVLVETLRRSGAGSVPEGTGALVLAEVDGASPEIVEAESLRLAEAAEAAGAIEVLMASHGGERDRLWAARRGLSDAIKEAHGFKIAEDVCVPRSRAAELLEGLRGIGERRGLIVASYGHAGDGNYHVNLLWDDAGVDPGPALADVFGLVLSLRGTITGEHGVGLAKRAWLPRELGSENIALLRDLKRVFDPAGLMNPGKIF